MHTYGSWEFLFSAAPTAQNSPELHFRFINYFIQPSLVGSLISIFGTLECKNAFDSDERDHLLIVFIFFYSAKILIATGYPFEVGQRIEILDLLEPHLRHDLIHDVPTTRVTISRHGLMARYFLG